MVRCPVTQVPKANVVMHLDGRTMANKRLTVARFIAAIKDSRGIKVVVCERVPCHLGTLNKWLAKHPTIAAAWEHECNRTLGHCHSILLDNIDSAKDLQEAEGRPVDMQDVKWYLARKGKHEGFGVEPTTPTIVAVVSIAAWRRNANSRLAQVEDME